jgi:uncharacterized membrane protein YdjX (TVP38/TMEM64 family)
VTDAGRSIARLAALAAGLAVAVLAFRALAPALVGGRLAHLFATGTPGGVAAFGLAATVACAVGMPRQAVCFAAGLAFGAAGGTAVAEMATVAACVADFGWSRLVARDWARRRVLGRYRRLAELDRLLAAQPFTAVLTLRLLPVGNSLMLSLLAGLSGARLLPFTLATALGALPQTVVFALLGSGIAVGHLARVVLAAALFALSAVVGLMLMRRQGQLLATAA